LLETAQNQESFDFTLPKSHFSRKDRARNGAPGGMVHVLETG